MTHRPIPRAGLFLAAFTLLLPLAACGGRESRLDVRTFQLRHRSGYDVERLIAPYVFTDRPGAPGEMSSTADAITVRETPDNLEKIARVLEEYDRPVPSMFLRFQLLEADGGAEPDSSIREVVEQLSRILSFRGYRLLGEAVVAVPDLGSGGGSFSQKLGDRSLSLGVDGEAVLLRPGVVRLERVSLWEALRSRTGETELLETSVSIREGQTVVIGTTRRTTDGRTVILAVRAEPGSGPGG